MLKFVLNRPQALMIRFRAQVIVGTILVIVLQYGHKADATSMDAVEGASRLRSKLIESWNTRRPAPVSQNRTPRSPEPSRISFAADNSAWVFVNGHFMRGTHNSSIAQTVQCCLQEGDVVAILAGSIQEWYGMG